MDSLSRSVIQKVRIAQQRGAIAAVIANNICLCFTARHKIEQIGYTNKVLSECKTLAEAAERMGIFLIDSLCQKQLDVMADDGTGRDVMIPSMLIDFYDAQRIRDCYFTARTLEYRSLTGIQCSPESKIAVDLTWASPLSSKVVKVEFWTSSETSALFEQKFQDVFLAFNRSIVFAPSYFIWDGKIFGVALS